MSTLETVQDVERAFGLAPSSSSTTGSAPKPEAQAAPPVVGKAPTVGDRFRFIGDRGEKTIPFQYPFELGGTEYHEYTLRRLNAEQVAEVGQELRRTGEMAVIYSAITGIPYVACKLMDADDAEAMAAAALDFMPAGLRALLEQQ